MAEIEAPPRRWELILSGVATFALTLAAILEEGGTLGALAGAAARIRDVPWWLKTVISVPTPVYWLLTAAVGAALYWAGVRLARRYGAPLLFMAPAVVLALQYLVPWLLYAPIRAATQGIKL
jgi:hypothetical protein